MQVRMKVAIPARDVAAGDVVEVSAHEAEAWLLNGNAVGVDEEVILEEDLDTDEDGADEEDGDVDADDEDTPEDFFDIS